MYRFRAGDIVTRKSYRGDIYFTIDKVVEDPKGNPLYLLRGLFYRIYADSRGDDLVLLNPRLVYLSMQHNLNRAKNFAFRVISQSRSFWRERAGGRPGAVLHIDSSPEFFRRCMEFYRDAGIKAAGDVYDEKDQPSVVRRLLVRHNPDILVVTGHDSLKKNSNPRNLDNYSNSAYFIQSVKEARSYEPSRDKLCIFAGACQSYFESIMNAGANFASSPGRIMINALDPSIVANKVAYTASTAFVSPAEVARATISGEKGIGGIRSRGQMKSR